MKRFVFRLESVRRLREQQEAAVQADLARIMADRNNVQQMLDKSRRAESELYAYLREPGRTAGDMANVAQYGTWHRQQIFNFTVRLRQFDQSIEHVRDRLKVARQRREALDRLYTRERAAWARAVQLEEQNELDEIGTIRAARARLAREREAVRA